jgi:hypothetical protein
MLYHYTLGIPDALRDAMPQGVFPLRLTAHAREQRDRRGVRIPDYLDTRSAHLVEVEERDGRPHKGLFRLPYGGGRDLVLAVAMDGRVWTVKTAWFNRADDNHKTLDVSRYARVK